MDNFNSSRFLHLLKYDLCQYRKQYLSMMVGIFIANTLGQLGVFYPATKYYPITTENFPSFADSAVEVFYFLLVMFMTVAAANVFGMLPNKRARISYFMLPASNLEKYLSRLLICLVLVPLFAWLSFVLADGIRILIYIGTDMPVQSVLPALWDSVCHYFKATFSVTDEGWPFILQGHVMIMSFIAEFILGSILFARRAAIIMWLLVIGFLVFAMMVLLTVPANSLHEAPSVAFAWVGFVIYSLLTVLFVWGAYRLFCRRQVTRRKFF